MNRFTNIVRFLKERASRIGTTTLLQEINKTKRSVVIVVYRDEKKMFTNAISLADIQRPQKFNGMSVPPILIDNHTITQLMEEAEKQVHDASDLIYEMLQVLDVPRNSKLVNKVEKFLEGNTPSQRDNRNVDAELQAERLLLSTNENWVTMMNGGKD